MGSPETIRMKATHFNVFGKTEVHPGTFIQFYDKKSKINVLIEIEETGKLIESLNTHEKRSQ